MDLKVKSLKNTKISKRNSWLFDNIPSNLISIIIGLNISLIVNLFTGSNKNDLLWLALFFFLLSLYFIFKGLFKRENLQNVLNFEISKNNLYQVLIANEKLQNDKNQSIPQKSFDENDGAGTNNWKVTAVSETDIIKKFYEDKSAEFKKFTCYLGIFVITIMSGVIITNCGNQDIETNTNKKVTTILDSLEVVKSHFNTLNGTIDSLQILLHQSIRTDSLNRRIYITHDTIHGK